MRFQSFCGSISLSYKSHKCFLAFIPLLRWARKAGGGWSWEISLSPGWIRLWWGLFSSCIGLCYGGHLGFISKWLPFPWIYWRMVISPLSLTKQKRTFPCSSLGKLDRVLGVKLPSIGHRLQLGNQEFCTLKLVHTQLPAIH